MKILKGCRIEEERLLLLYSCAGTNEFTEAVNLAIDEYVCRHNIESYDKKLELDATPVNQTEFWLRCSDKLRVEIKDFSRLFNFPLNEVQKRAFELYIKYGKIEFNTLYESCGGELEFIDKVV
jgi:hypothetical protein